MDGNMDDRVYNHKFTQHLEGNALIIHKNQKYKSITFASILCNEK